jgi:copper chaperone CopZ
MMEKHCHIEPVQKTTIPEEHQTIELALLVVTVMGCSNCETRVRNSLLSLYGVINAFVDHITGTAGVVFNPELASIDMLINAVASAGNDGQHEYSARLLNRRVSP